MQFDSEQTSNAKEEEEKKLPIRQSGSEDWIKMRGEDGKKG